MRSTSAVRAAGVLICVSVAAVLLYVWTPDFKAAAGSFKQASVFAEAAFLTRKLLVAPAARVSQISAIQAPSATETDELGEDGDQDVNGVQVLSLQALLLSELDVDDRPQQEGAADVLSDVDVDDDEYEQRLSAFMQSLLNTDVTSSAELPTLANLDDETLGQGDNGLEENDPTEADAQTETTLLETDIEPNNH